MPEQAEQPESNDPKKNHLLARLQPEDYDALMVAKIVPLKFGKRVFRQDDRIEAVYFR
jgi:hypothetical protein